MELITVRDAADRLKVSDKAVYLALSEGRLTKHKSGGTVLVDANELQGYKPNAKGDMPRGRRGGRLRRSDTYRGLQDNAFLALTGKDKQGYFRQQVYERDNGRCQLCGNPVRVEDMHLDHIIPQSLGGSDDYANMQVACPACNCSKGNHGNNHLPAGIPTMLHLSEDARRLFALLMEKTRLRKSDCANHLIHEAARAEGLIE